MLAEEAVSCYFSSMGNPFSSESDAKVCPFLGNVVLPVIPQKSALMVPNGQPTEIDIAVKYNRCVKAQCTFWNEEEDECHIKLGMISLGRLEVKLGPLANMFGK